uniref:Uncharacterized protein n=1 Tax=Setaria italica TaxID=4555 RepID=K3Y4G4_SETIT
MAPLASCPPWWRHFRDLTQPMKFLVTPLVMGGCTWWRRSRRDGLAV